MFQEHRLHSWVQSKVIALEHRMKDLHQLVPVVVLKVNDSWKARSNARIMRKQHVHLVLVSRQDDHQIIPVVFDQLDQCVEGLPTEGVFVIRNQRICLVDEQNASKS